MTERRERIEEGEEGEEGGSCRKRECKEKLDFKVFLIKRKAEIK